MLDCQVVFEAIGKQGIRFFAGVPDSLLKDLCAYISDHTTESEHVIAANEGNAVALAIGHYLGTAQPALVYMQNSGIGNAVNPLLSLADPDVYSIPVLLVIGWRGEPGRKDEPQHVKQGRTMTDLLDAMEIPWFQLPSDAASAVQTIEAAGKEMRANMGPVAIVVSAGTFDRYSLRRQTATDYPMNREDAIKRILDQLDERDIVISTTGKASREVYEYRQAAGSRGIDFLTVGGMGHTASIAMGVGMAQTERRVICLDGDGSAIMHMGALGVIGSSGPSNLLHIVINNGAHDSVGGQPTVGYGIDVPAIASACGYRDCATVTDPDALESQIAHLRQCDGPVLLEVRVNKGARPDLGRPASTPIENRDSLMAALDLQAATNTDGV